MTGKILGREMKLRMKMKMMKMIIFLIDVDSRGDAALKRHGVSLNLSPFIRE